MEKSKLIEEIRGYELHSLELIQQGKIEDATNYLDKNIILLNQGSNVIIGKDHETDTLEEQEDTGVLKFSYEPKIIKVSNSGDMAIVYGEIETTFKDKIIYEKYITIWEKNADKWLITMQMKNTNQ